MDQRPPSEQPALPPDETGTLAFMTRTMPGQDFGQQGTCSTTITGGGSDVEPPQLIDNQSRLEPTSDSARFQVGDLLGHGGGGQVFAMADSHLDRQVALKVCHHKTVGNEKYESRFIREARITASLEHPHILPVYNLDRASDERLYYTMRKASGASLEDLILAAGDGSSAPPVIASISDRVAIMLKVADAMAYAHSRGVIHQDIKPGNIMIGEYGEVVVVDWGTAVHADDPDIGRHLMGTPAYMSPEQVRRDGVDRRSDVYCMGATFFHLLTFRFPVALNDMQDFWAKKRLGIIDPLPPAIRRLYPDHLLAVCERAMAGNPDERYADASAFRDDLALFQRHQGSLALCDEAEQQLADEEALNAQGYSAFNDLTASLRSARKQWPDNQRATRLMLQARAAHARFALDHGNVELAAELIDADEPSHADLRLALEDARLQQRRERRRQRRLRQAALLLLLALIGAGIWGVREYQRQFADWAVIYTMDFTSPDATTDGLAYFKRSRLQHSPLPVPEDRGLFIEHYCWLRLDELRERGDVRVELEFIQPNFPNSIQIMVHAEDQDPPSWWHSPRGYAGEIGGMGASVDFVSVYHQQRGPLLNHMRLSKLASGSVQRMVFEKDGDTLRLYHNGELSVSLPIRLPVGGQDNNRIDIRCWADTWVRSLVVKHRSLPEKASPIKAADLLLFRGHTGEARDEYRRLAQEFAGHDLARQAWVRCARSADMIDDQHTLEEALAILAATAPGSREHVDVLTLAAGNAWRHERYDAALDIVREVFERDPENSIVLSLLEARRDIPLSVANRLMVWIGRSRQLVSLDLSLLGISDLEPLRGLQLRNLDCRGNRISDLRPLAGMPLKRLDIQGNAISDLSPLAGMPLDQFNGEDNDISDLTPLVGLPLRKVYLAGNAISDLSPLRGMSIEQISIARNFISDLRPLSGLNISELNCADNPISDLSPLAGKPMSSINAPNCQISDLSPLTGMPLTSINIANNPVNDLSPLVGMPLANITASRTPITDIAALAQMPLKRVRLERTTIADLSPLANKQLELLLLNDCGIERLDALGKLAVQTLDLRGNPCHDLKPLAEVRIELFWADREIFAHPSADGLLAAWEANDMPASSIAQLRGYIASVRSPDPASLREAAVQIDGRRYLALPELQTYEQALAACERYGARLPTLDSESRQLAIERHFNPSIEYCFWIGLRDDGDGLRWMTGDRLMPGDYSRIGLKERIEPPPVGSCWRATPRIEVGPWLPRDPQREYIAILEWDD